MGYGHVNLYSARLLCDIARHCDLAIDSIVYANLTSDALFANRGGGLKTALYRGFRKGLFQFSPELGDDLFVTVRKVSAKQQTSAMFDLSNSSVRQAREAAREIRPFHRKLEE